MTKGEKPSSPLPRWVLARVAEEAAQAIADVDAMALDPADRDALLAERAKRAKEVLLNDQGIKLQLIQITLDQATPEQRERIDELIAAGNREGAWAYLDKIAKRRPKED